MSQNELDNEGPDALNFQIEDLMIPNNQAPRDENPVDNPWIRAVQEMTATYRPNGLGMSLDEFIDRRLQAQATAAESNETRARQSQDLGPIKPPQEVAGDTVTSLRILYDNGWYYDMKNIEAAHRMLDTYSAFVGDDKRLLITPSKSPDEIDELVVLAEQRRQEAIADGRITMTEPLSNQAFLADNSSALTRPGPSSAGPQMGPQTTKAPADAPAKTPAVQRTPEEVEILRKANRIRNRERRARKKGRQGSQEQNQGQQTQVQPQRPDASRPVVPQTANQRGAPIRRGVGVQPRGQVRQPTAGPGQQIPGLQIQRHQTSRDQLNRESMRRNDGPVGSGWFDRSSQLPRKHLATKEELDQDLDDYFAGVNNSNHDATGIA
ncbi:hypothetical protein F5Y16DRAFT_406620 [Xylariaceae sp. FL0255]|nr:hypothetical protein F5Y16DRAFT_406620 [Xylariaceae sp. FL0255]